MHVIWKVWSGVQRIGGKHGIRVIYCFIFLFRTWPSHVTSLFPSSFLTLLMWVVLVSADSVSLSSILDASSVMYATFIHDVLCLADTLRKNPYFSDSRSILKGIVLCFHALPIVFMCLVAVHIRNVMFLWAWSVVSIMIYIVSTVSALKEVRKGFECVEEFFFSAGGIAAPVAWVSSLVSALVASFLVVVSSVLMLFPLMLWLLWLIFSVVAVFTYSFVGLLFCPFLLLRREVWLMLRRGLYSFCRRSHGWMGVC